MSLIQITDPFLLPDGTQWTGTIIYTLLYATTVDGATVVGAQQALQIANGISVQLAPGLYTVQMNQSGLRDVITAQWGVPTSGGPYTVAEISSNVTLQGGFGPVTLTGTPSTGQVPTATGPTTATWQAAGGGGGPVSVATVTLTSEQVLALGSVSQTVIPAQGAGTVILPFNVVVQVNGSATYNASNLHVNLGSGTVASLDPFGFGGAYTTYLVNDFIGAAIVFGEGSSYTNQPITVSAADDVSGTGGTMVVTIFYMVVSGVSD